MSNILLESALDYIQKGWPVLPLNYKSPILTAWPQTAFTDPDKAKQWWAKGSHNIAMVTGNRTQICVLDVDKPGGEESLAKLIKLHGPLPETLMSKTGRGGKHYYFKIPEGVTIPKKTGFKHKLDMLGEKGCAILPPSKTEESYEWLNATEIATIPNWLIEEVHKTETRKPTQLHANGTATRYGANALSNGIIKIHDSQKGERNTTLYCVAKELGKLIAGNELCENLVYETLTQAALEVGLDTDEIEPTINSGVETGKKTPRISHDRNSDVSVISANIENIYPIPFEKLDLPQLPIDGMPDLIKEMSFAMAEEIQVQPETVFMNMLGAIATAAQSKLKVEIKPGYCEHINLYAACALNPAERKSAIVSRCKKPLFDWQSKMRRKYRQLIEEAKMANETTNIAIKAIQKEVVKAKSQTDRDSIKKRVLNLKDELHEIPNMPRLLVDDFTPESISELLAQHNECLGLLEAEGGLFETLAGRYNRGVANLDAVLKSWDGESCQVDRKGHDPIILECPLLTLVLTPQPTIVQGLASKRIFRERGLAGRFLYLMPNSLFGNRAIDTEITPKMLTHQYEQLINSLLKIPWNTQENEGKKPHIVPLTAEAYSIWKKMYLKVETMLGPNGELENMTDWGGKFPGQIARVAGILHCVSADMPHKRPINETTMKAAVSLARPLIEHAKAAYLLMGLEPAIDCAQKILKWVQTEQVESFTGRDALEKVKGTYPTMNKVNEGLSILEERAFIFSTQRPPYNKRGRPSERYLVNPLGYMEKKKQTHDSASS